MAQKFWRVFLPGFILAVGIGTTLVLVLMPRGEARVPKVEPVPLVEVARVRAHEGPVDIYADGVVVPHRQIQLAAQVDGTIVFKADVCRAGFYVPPGTLLIRIDPTDYRLQVERLEQDVRQAANALQQLEVEIANVQELLRVAKSDYQLEQRSFARQEELHRNRIISDEDFEQAQRAVLKAENAVVTLENQLRAAQARKEGLQAALARAQTQLAEAKTRLGRTEIYAPADVETVVIREAVEVGDYVRSGALLAVLEDVSQVEVRVNLRRDQLSWIWAAGGETKSTNAAANPAEAYRLPELPVTVVHEIDGAQFAWAGKLWRYEGLGLNEATRTVPCRVLVPDARSSRPLRVPQGWRVPAGPPALMRGMFVSLRIHLPAAVPMLSLPEPALQPGNWVWRCELLPADSPQEAAPPGAAGLAPPGAEASTAEGASGQTHGGPSDRQIHRGRIFRVEVAPVSWRLLTQIVFADKGGESVVDGRTLKFENGRLVRVSTGDSSPEIVYEGPVMVVTPEGAKPLDGAEYQVIDGFVYHVTPQGATLLAEPNLQLPLGAPLGFRQRKEILVPARAGYLDPDCLVVVTPLVAGDGTIVEVRGLP
ncbi:MAG: hypothetical protein NZ899_14705 [Thermoguttaceae bacterium]|nr:hypothetical protein [Thermoguttaceae bacterium]MDW8079555.1 hypothetical protein [Thermoguttaceae bacterium]